MYFLSCFYFHKEYYCPFAYLYQLKSFSIPFDPLFVQTLIKHNGLLRLISKSIYLIVGVCAFHYKVELYAKEKKSCAQHSLGRGTPLAPRMPS